MTGRTHLLKMGQTSVISHQLLSAHLLLFKFSASLFCKLSKSLLCSGSRSDALEPSRRRNAVFRDIDNDSFCVFEALLP